MYGRMLRDLGDMRIRREEKVTLSKTDSGQMRKLESYGEHVGMLKRVEWEKESRRNNSNENVV